MKNLITLNKNIVCKKHGVTDSWVEYFGSVFCGKCLVEFLLKHIELVEFTKKLTDKQKKDLSDPAFPFNYIIRRSKPSEIK